MAHKPAVGIGSKNIVRPGVRNGAARQHIHPGGVAQLGQRTGDHATMRGATGYRGESLIGPKHPISAKLGNEVAAQTVCGPGGSRTVMRTGSQGAQGSVNPGNPMPKGELFPGWPAKK